MKRRVSLFLALLVTSLFLSSCSVIYYDHVYLEDERHELHEFGVLGFPEEKTGDHGPGGLVPLWRSTNPMEPGDYTCSEARGEKPDDE